LPPSHSQPLSDLIEHHQIAPPPGLILLHGSLQLPLIQPDAATTGTGVNPYLTQGAFHQVHLTTGTPTSLKARGARNLLAAFGQFIGKIGTTDKLLQFFSVKPDAKTLRATVDF
jgi:hypothetical protein